MRLPALLDIYMKIMFLVFGLTLGFYVLLAGTHAALAANLKTLSVIEGDTLTVGDIFEGVSAERAAYVLGPAPQPGQDMVLNARTLMRISSAMNLSWQPQSAGDQVVIRRAATVIREDLIRSTLADEIRDAHHIDQRFELAFSGGPTAMILPQDLPATIEISSLKLDPQTDRFSATISAPSKEKAHAEIAVVGKIRRLIPVPVLKNTLREGDVINAHDISWIDIYSDELQHDIILQEDKILGLTPRRMAAAGKPLRDRELQEPQVVARGDTITIIYKEGFMELIAKGKALQDGARGDFIRVVNTTSNRSLEGTVSGERQVIIQ